MSSQRQAVVSPCQSRWRAAKTRRRALVSTRVRRQERRKWPPPGWPRRSAFSFLCPEDLFPIRRTGDEALPEHPQQLGVAGSEVFVGVIPFLSLLPTRLRQPHQRRCGGLGFELEN